ncbi:MAG TPA: HAMP domain-containing sensor histidine kinase [Anaerolineaceae bacterium]|nr:HAMP domain-containing sensor histidine kinase [Anaerolineaceae bacterium]
MSLRTRLTLRQVALFALGLVVLCALVYALVSFVVLNKIDTLLADSAALLVDRMRLTEGDNFDIQPLLTVPLPEDLYLQVWGGDRLLQYSHPATFQIAMDTAGWDLGRPAYTTVNRAGLQMRVLSVPLETARGPAGMLMVGFSLSLLTLAHQTLLLILIVVSILLLSLMALSSYLSNSQMLTGLTKLTRLMPELIKMNDLSQRLPDTLLKNDEVGALSRTFNAALDRLETLLTSQRRFMADVSHELRTPLTVIKGEVGLMRRMGKGDKESLHSIEAEVDRLTRMVGDLLMLAQAESGRLPLNLSMINLDEVLMEVYQQALVLSPPGVLVRLLEMEPLVIEADRDRIKQVLLNLAGNALRYTASGGQVMLSLRSASGGVQIQVSDTGKGIPADDLPRIFERFYRGERSRKREKEGGLGLGLSISYLIIKAHSGRIDVTSQESVGTTFTIWLPLTQR